jgi:hypothetical protein
MSDFHPWIGKNVAARSNPFFIRLLNCAPLIIFHKQDLNEILAKSLIIKSIQ